MYDVLTLMETLTNGYKAEALDLLTLIAILCGILVIVSKNPVVSVLFLIGLFLSISSYLLVLGINFIGLSYLLVYVGAVSILFLFILMLINIRVSELVDNTSRGIVLAIVIALAFNYPIFYVLPFSITDPSSVNLTSLPALASDLNQVFTSSPLALRSTEANTALADNLLNGPISFATSKAWDSSLAENSHITSIGNLMYTSYSIWLIITSIILLLAMVGAIVITIKQKDSTLTNAPALRPELS